MKHFRKDFEELAAKAGIKKTCKVNFSKRMRRRNERDPRAFAEVDPHKLEFHFAPQVLDLPREYQRGLIAHELGHVLCKDLPGGGTEADADAAAWSVLGVRIEYDCRWPGKGLQREAQGVQRTENPALPRVMQETLSLIQDSRTHRLSWNDWHKDPIKIGSVTIKKSTLDALAKRGYLEKEERIVWDGMIPGYKTVVTYSLPGLQREAQGVQRTENPGARVSKADKEQIAFSVARKYMRSADDAVADGYKAAAFSRSINTEDGIFRALEKYGYNPTKVARSAVEAIFILAAKKIRSHGYDVREGDWQSRWNPSDETRKPLVTYPVEHYDDKLVAEDIGSLISESIDKAVTEGTHVEDDGTVHIYTKAALRSLHKDAKERGWELAESYLDVDFVKPNPPYSGWRKGWWKKPLPKDQTKIAYPTKTDALNVFLDHNRAIVDDYGGESMVHSPESFEAINHRFDIKGPRRVDTIAKAVWWALPPGSPYYLEDIDVHLLNETAPAIYNPRGLVFRIPDYAEEAALLEKEAEYWLEKYGDVEYPDEGDVPF